MASYKIRLIFDFTPEQLKTINILIYKLLVTTTWILRKQKYPIYFEMLCYQETVMCQHRDRIVILCLTVGHGMTVYIISII